MGYVPSPLTTHNAYLICCVLTQCIVTSIYTINLAPFHETRLHHMRRKVNEWCLLTMLHNYVNQISLVPRLTLSFLLVPCTSDGKKATTQLVYINSPFLH